jgi:hypothetical protein
MPTLAEVQQALQRCMSAEPAVEFALSADASRLSTVFAEMLYAKEVTRDLDQFSEKEADAYRRWLVGVDAGGRSGAMP